MCMIVKIDKLSHDFRGIARVNDKVTFVSGVIPGETVDITPTNKGKNADEAKVVSFIQTSDDRAEPTCPYFGLCGGCDISYIKYEKALEYKRDIVSDIMKRYANVTVEPDIVYDGKIYGYRNKVSLKVSEGRLALTKGGSNKLVKIDRCLLVNDNINRVIEVLNNVDLSGALEVVIKGTNDIMVIVSGDIDSDMVIRVLKDNVSIIVLNDEVIYGNEYIKIDVNNLSYAVRPKSFFQVNTGMIGKLYDKVKEYASTGQRLLDLYCGAGTIGLYLAGNFDEVVGIEVNNDAVISANLNKEINDIHNISFECKKANEISTSLYDVIVVDPPRAGLDKITINKIRESLAKRIVYVSCNPITLARDINLLKDKYELVDMTLFDMFLNTKHVESVALLCLKEN